MSSLITAVFKATIGLLVNKGRDKLAEKLNEGDVTDQKFRGLIVREIDEIKSKLDGLARKDLLASISLFKEGIVLLYEVFETARPSSEHRAITAAATACVEQFDIAKEMRKLDISALDESAMRKLGRAKKRFKEARLKAMEAFNNVSLQLPDRLLAMKYRLMATILETVDNPAEALAACSVCLDELHQVPAVREYFKVELEEGLRLRALFNKDERRQIIFSVCHANRVIYDVMSMLGSVKRWTLPYIETGKEKVDPLRNERVVKILAKQDTLPLHIASFGSEDFQVGAEVRFVTLEEKTVFDKVQIRSGGIAKQPVPNGIVQMEARSPVGQILGIKVWVLREPSAGKLHQDQNRPVELEVIHGRHDTEKHYFSVNLDSVYDGPFAPVYQLAKVEMDKRNIFQLLVELSFHNGLEEKTQKFYSKPFMMRSRPRNDQANKNKKRKLSGGSDEEEEIVSSLVTTGQSLQRTDTCIHRRPLQRICHVISSTGGVVTEMNIKLVFPPGAVENPVSVSISLEDPSRYYGLIVQNSLENDVVFGAPVIRLEPDGLLFKKPVTLTVKFEIGNFTRNDIVVLNGREERSRMITWEDVTPNSVATTLDESNAEVWIKTEHFSLIAILLTVVRFTQVHLLTRFNLMSFHYTLSVWLNDNSMSPKSDELALLFVSQDVYHEQFYEKQEASAMIELKNKGFRKLHVRPMNDHEETGIFNNERLHITIYLGEDYNLAGRQHEITSDFQVDSSVWWSMGYVVPIPLERSMKDVRIACGTITVKGAFGHISERKFCEVDLCGYVRNLLKVHGDIFNTVPIARVLEMPEELINQVVMSWRGDDEQLNIILQQMLRENYMAEDLTSLTKDLECWRKTKQGSTYNLTQRGQMHVRHLREYTAKISGLQRTDANLMKYFACQIQSLCNTLLRDCCIELETSAEGVERAASSSSYVHYLEIHRPVPEDIKERYPEIFSSPNESIKAFVAVVPNLIQIAKEIFVEEEVSKVQNGLRGLPKETIDQFDSSIRNAERNNKVGQLVYDVSRILELLCLKNCNLPSIEIKKWGENLAVLHMLEVLKPFYKHCKQDVRLYKRLELFSGRLRDIVSEQVDTTDRVILRDFCNVSLSLVNFAKFDPSKLVKFELINSTNVALTFHSESVEYDSSLDTYSQRFHLKKKRGDELQLCVVACVHIDGQISKKGAFQSVIVINPSGEDVLNRCVVHLVDVAAIKLEEQASDVLRVCLCSTKKEKLLEALDDLKKKLGTDLVETRQEVSKSHLKIRTVNTVETVVSLRLAYKWGSEAVSLDSKDFLTLADSSAGGTCIPEVHLVGVNDSQMPENFGALSLASADETYPLASFDQLQKHGQIQCEKLEYHLHQTFNQMSGHVCVAGDRATVNEQIPSQCAIQEGPSSAPKKCITEGKRS